MSHLIVMRRHVHIRHAVYRRPGHAHRVHLTRRRIYVDIRVNHRTHRRHWPVHRSAHVAHVVCHVIGMILRRAVVPQRTVDVVQRTVWRHVTRMIHVVHYWPVGHVLRARHVAHRTAQRPTHRRAQTVSHIVHGAAHRWPAELRVAHVTHAHVIVHGIDWPRGPDIRAHIVHWAHTAHWRVIHGRHAAHVVHVIAHPGVAHWAHLMRHHGIHAAHCVQRTHTAHRRPTHVMRMVRMHVRRTTVHHGVLHRGRRRVVEGITRHDRVTVRRERRRRQEVLKLIWKIEIFVLLFLLEGK